MSVAGQRPNSRYGMAIRDMYTISENIFEAVFSERYVPILCREDQFSGGVSNETVKYGHEFCGTWTRE
jgi:hypothetical protein